VTALRDEALRTLQGWTAPHPRQERLRREHVDHLLAHPDGTSRECRPAHVTAGALLLSADGDRVLLTLHAKARRWFHLGGHCEPGDVSLAAAALREATEESGVEGIRLDPEPLQLDRHDVDFCGSQGHARHLDVRHLAVAPPGAVPALSEESIDVRWWPVDGLPTDEADLLELVRLGVARQRSSAANGSRAVAETPSR
jgi:8-oxo-dGTP pyrophosphatase MutT (NUDIX family)